MALVAALPVALAGCADDQQAEPVPADSSAAPVMPTAVGTSSAPAPVPRAAAGVRVVRTVATGLDVPWGLAELPDGRVLVGERDTGRIDRLDVASGQRRTIGRVAAAVSNVASGGEAGLLGLAVSPRFALDHRVYAYYSTSHDNRIAWLPLRHGRLGRPHVILAGIPLGIHHDGGRLAFGPDGLLYAGTGETGVPDLAQQLSSLGGKILRMTRTGRAAPGNPFGTLVYSYGHRNVQGLAFDPDGRLWASEFGDHTADELNLIEAGRDYGWPAVEGMGSDPAYTNPVATWGTDEDSPSGIAYAHGAIWMAALHGARLWRIPLHGATAGQPQAFLTDRFGRLRSVLALGPHRLLVTTSNRDGRGTVRPGDDRILLLRVR